MKNLKFGIFALLLMITAGCHEEATSNEQSSKQETQTAQRTARQTEPIEVTNFRNKIKEIVRLNKDFTDQQKSELLYDVAKDLLDVHGMPQDTREEPGFTDEKGKTAILGFRRFIELIKTKQS